MNPFPIRTGDTLQKIDGMVVAVPKGIKKKVLWRNGIEQRVHTGTMKICEMLPIHMSTPRIRAPRVARRGKYGFQEIR